MYYLKLIIITTFIFSSLSLSADCPSHIPMNTGGIAPCRGMFLNDDLNESVKKDLRDNEIRKKQIELKDLQIQELSKDRDKWAKEAENQAKARHASDGDLRKGIIYGVLGTVVAILGARALSK